MKTPHLLCAVALAAASLLGTAPAAAQVLKPVQVLKGLDNPWALAFLPDGRMLVTERTGQLRLALPDGKLSDPLAGLPAISVGGQCGLLDVVADPQFAQNQRIFFTFAEPAGAGESGNSTAVGRARLVGEGLNAKLEDVRTIFSQKPKMSSRHHCGSRIVFDRNGALLVGLGDRFAGKDEAQNPANHIGKVIRIDADGKALPDNPFVGKSGADEVFSLGHRNIQGAALHPRTGELWASEHGPQGGDEINRVQAGKNYGWPVVTYGRNYVTGTRIGDDGPKDGYVHPLRHWVPTSVAPSGLVFLTSERYPGWQGSLFMGALRGTSLIRLTLDGDRITGEERLLTDFKQRIRDVRQGPDGWLYIVTDGDGGQVLRLER